MRKVTHERISQSQWADCDSTRRYVGPWDEVNFIKARRLVKGQPEYLIKWKGFDDDKYDTWEGLANLSGLEPDLATFEAQQKKDQEEFVKQMAARKAAKAAAKAAASDKRRPASCALFGGGLSGCGGRGCGRKGGRNETCMYGTCPGWKRQLIAVNCFMSRELICFAC